MRWLAACCALWFSLSAQAELHLQLHTDGLSAAERRVSQALLDEAIAALPPSFIERLDQPVAVRWQTLAESVYGQVSRGTGIELNAALLPALLDGSAHRQSLARHHGTQYRELLATLVHELTHLYDRARLWPDAQRRHLAFCARRANQSGAIGLPENCRGQTERRFSLSDDPTLLDLAGWPQRVGQRGARESRNDQVERSPDPYELTSPLEFVAVNLEYFLLDPHYACRRPSLARFFREHFAWSPPTASPCRAELAYLNAGADFSRQPLARLDPARVYEVDYLLADANEALMSRWGHSMLRLVVCAPDRPPGPDCRLDLEHHLVLSYRAFVGDVQLSSWDGLTGAYPSRLFILPLEQVIEEYTKVELRSLLSVPLRLTTAQVRQLVERAVEQHWSYDGRYYFIGNNCAVETLKLLRSGTQAPALLGLDSILPNGLLTLLGARQLADLTVLDDVDQARRLGYRFDSFRERYEAMFAVLRQRLAIDEQDVHAWLELPAEARRHWVAQADLRAAAAMLLLEQAALRRQLLLAQDELKRRYLSGRELNDPSVTGAGAALEQILADSGFLSRPAELLDGGYGLPLGEEWQALEQRTEQRRAQLSKLTQDLDEEVRKLLEPARLKALEAIEGNLQVVAERLRTLHRESGGVQLP